MALNKWDLWVSYANVKDTLAFKDLDKLLKTKLDRAMLLLKDKEDPEARATWKLIDTIYNHLSRVEKEGIKEYETDKAKQK